MKIERRGGARPYTPCVGSGDTLVFEKDGNLHCAFCGKRVGVSPLGKVYRHKALSRVVQEWGGPLVTKTGKVLTDEDIEALADEAERGYDVSHLKERRREDGP